MFGTKRQELATVRLRKVL